MVKTYKHYFNKEDLNIPEDKTVLFCMQMSKKLNIKFYHVLKQILEKIPDSVVLLSEIISEEKKKFIQDMLQNKAIFVEKCFHKNFICHIKNSDIVLIGTEWSISENNIYLPFADFTP